MIEAIPHRKELEAQIEKLEDFRHSTEFLALDRDEQLLLNRQFSLMHELSDVLTQRIARLKI